MSARICLECPATLGPRNVSGRCRSCASRAALRDPERAERRMAAQRAAMACPEYRARKRAERARIEAERRDDPAWHAYNVASGQRLRAQYDASPEARAKNLAKRTHVGRQNSLRRLGWLPDARRREYINMRSRLGAAEAKRRILASMTPFERQLARVAGGATLVDRFVPPTRTYSFTLGGVAPEAM